MAASFTESWARYPADVPVEQRKPCAAGCGRPAEVVQTLSRNQPGFTFLPSGDVTITPYCEEHARERGWNPQVPHPENAAHLNAVQRWLGRLLTHGEDTSGEA